jgi:translation initiation factor 3 subunit J
LDLGALLNANPKTKEDFNVFSKQIVDIIVKRHQNKPLYATFVEQLVKDVASPLRDVDIRKAASGLTALANEKQREAKEKTTGKKKKPVKPALGGAKTVNKYALPLTLDDLLLIAVS